MHLVPAVQSASPALNTPAVSQRPQLNFIFHACWRVRGCFEHIRLGCLSLLLWFRRGESVQELAFLDLKYEVEIIRPGMDAETLTVLDGVSGQANSKEMLALVRHDIRVHRNIYTFTSLAH